ncbi:cyclophane-forming radical SAM/SPASM peptide maturase GrrM/OscB [Reyranella sp.]|uniref:cyclophane-forming radical SAM/SPASM peptide maturase GrrM/OscB n=1 Tax=Reyranella sp. TaxID=1929291 RepID=UPI003783916F
MLVLQGTPFCNIACDYCYLPGRDDKRRMDHDTVGAAIEFLYREGLAGDTLDMVWHAGEPLALPRAWYERAFATAAAAAPHGVRLQHCVQTNATLIDAEWCDFFLSHDVRVGVSLDGPARLHDARRRTRRGVGTHAAAMKGVRALRRHGVPFHAICVVTREALDSADDVVDFFLAEGVGDVGFNIEEVEGINCTSSLAAGADTPVRFARFLDRVLERAEASGQLTVREERNLRDMLQSSDFGQLPGNDQNTPFSIVTVARDGTLSTFSPELAGLSHPRLGSFALGNVKSATLAGILADPRWVALSEEVAEGVRACAARCPYFRLCLGGAPSNKLAELGTAAGTETLFCRLTQVAVAEVVLPRLEARLKAATHPV